MVHSSMWKSIGDQLVFNIKHVEMNENSHISSALKLQSIGGVFTECVVRVFVRHQTMFLWMWQTVQDDSLCECVSSEDSANTVVSSTENIWTVNCES